MNLVRQKGYPYSFDQDACQNCRGRCCKGRSGHIWVNSAEIGQIAAFLKRNLIDVMGTFLNRAGNRLSIKERPAGNEYECIFFDSRKQQCTIYTARPAQCRSFPFWPYYLDRPEEAAEECPGVKPDSESA